MKYDYTYFPENTEITADQARELLADYHAGKVEMDPRMVEIAERYVKEEQGK